MLWQGFNYLASLRARTAVDSSFVNGQCRQGEEDGSAKYGAESILTAREAARAHDLTCHTFAPFLASHNFNIFILACGSSIHFTR